MNKMSKKSRIIIGVGALAMIIMFFVPAWSIYLIAPQYPEGLSMQIWLYKLTGQVDIINGLNHYIGMKHIEVQMFPEFDFLVYILGFFILFGLIVAITGSRKLLFIYLLLSVIGGVAALVDFYLWGYNYGHDLDPSAAIQVPGLSYQPPVIGHKKLLNFDSYSYPDTGGWVVVTVTGVYFIVWLLEFLKHKRQGAGWCKVSLPHSAAKSCHPHFSGMRHQQVAHQHCRFNAFIVSGPCSGGSCGQCAGACGKPMRIKYALVVTYIKRTPVIGIEHECVVRNIRKVAANV